MGSAYSSYPYDANLGIEFKPFKSNRTGVLACRWGDIEASTRHWKEDNGQTEVWRVNYKNIQNEKHACVLEIQASSDYNGVARVYFRVGDSSADNETKLALEITRVARDGVSARITALTSSTGAAPVPYTGTKHDGYSTETFTTTVSYGCSQRYGAFVLEMKRNLNSQNAYKAILLHYYATKDVGLCVRAKISRTSFLSGFGVEVTGPYNFPHMLPRGITSLRSRDNSDGSAKASMGNKTETSNHSLQSNNQQGEDATGQMVKGLINNLGGPAGPLSGSIFINCILKDFPEEMFKGTG